MKTRQKVTKHAGNLLQTLRADPQLSQQVASISSQLTIHLVAPHPSTVPAAALASHDSSTDSSTDGSLATFDSGPLSSSGYVRSEVPSEEPWAEAPVSKIPGERWLPVRHLLCPGAEKHVTAEYRLVGELGRGGTGIVYQAHQRAVDREVAVKVLREELASDPIARQQFLAEATTIGGLDHPNVIAIHELGKDQLGRLFYSMKRVDGTAWSAVIDDRTLNENLQTLLRVSDALAYAHSRGLVHRDIKPENVMLGPFGEVLVADWGLAVPHPLPVGSTDSMVSIGGTPAYMAPELAMGNLEDVSPLTDVYLLGAVLYRILTGAPPHEGSSLVECLQSAADNLIRATDVQGELMDVSRRAMASEPEERYGSVAEFQSAIQNFLQHQESVGLVDRARKLLKRGERGAGYESYGLALTMLQEALELWPSNRRAERILRETRLAFARRATEQGDLDLAWTMVEAASAEDTELGRKIRQMRETRCQQHADANRFAQLFAHSPDAVLLTRLEDGMVLEANDLLFDLVGYDRDQVVGRSVLDIQLWESPRHRDEFVRDMLRRQRVDSVEIGFTRPDGRRIWVLLSARLMEFDDQRLVVAHIRDNSARKLAEYQLQRSRMRLREIQDLAKLGTWELDLLDGRMYWGEESVRMLGGRDAPTSLEEYFELIHPEDRDAVKKVMENAVDRGAAFHLEIRLLRANGTYNRVVTRGQPILEDGRTVELFGIFLDVPDHRPLA